MRISRAPRAVWAYVRAAPGTYVWLGILFVTTVALHHMSPEFEQEFLRRRSTNLQELSSNPVRVLVASAMWIDGGHWLPYAALYSLFHARVEHHLGTARWLLVCVAAHVLATLISQAGLLIAIQDGIAPPSLADTMDIGVSYALAGVAAVLTYLIRSPWRYGYLAVLLVMYTEPLTGRPTFTDFGHFLAVLIGLACHPLTRSPRKQRNPKETVTPDNG